MEIIYIVLNNAPRKEVINVKHNLYVSVSKTPQTDTKEINPIAPRHVETVCLLVLRNPVTHINIDVDVEELVQDKRGQAMYPQIKEYVLEQTGLKVSSLYISQIKRKCGLDVGESYNKPKTEDAKVPQCPPEKEKAIMDALRHFGLI